MANEWCACGNNITAGKCLEESMLLIITEKQFNAVADKNADALLMLLPDMCKYEYYLCPNAKSNRSEHKNRQRHLYMRWREDFQKMK